ncbi:Exo-alpha-sialidase neuraminidase [Pleurostoma richardsiae]|uniref:Exo-alpha-sialidase neuraminidase n=1 Tax=Pleurostoma richardsiae TaxID=41990 RepID=A0AA38VI05_9PEZI|nr:Exo-alpha-sialidase neuraminidase [Pleurostoma richardsiae]
MPPLMPRWAVPVVYLLSSVFALEVTPGSECASVCLNQPDSDASDPKSSWTNSTDIVCENVDYFSSSTGEKYKSCVECLQTSDAVSGSENDLSWFLYNLRFAVSVCLFDFPGHTKNTSTPCDIDYACQPLQGALESGDLDPANVTEFQYCSVNGGAFGGEAVTNCVQCMQASSGQTYLSNFLVALQAGCQQKPAPGLLLGLDGSLFSNTLVNSTNAPVNQTATASQTEKKSSVMTVGTIVGIAVGAGLLLLGGIALFIVYWRRQKKLARGNADRDDLGDKGSHSSVTVLTLPTARTIISSRNTPTNFTMDYKSEPQVQDYEMRENNTNRDYLSNSEYYDEMEGKSRGRPLKNLDESPDTLTRPVVSDSALPTHPAYLPRSFLPVSRTPSPNATPLPKASPKGSITSTRSNQAPPPYAIQTYLKSSEHVKFPPPPPGAPPPLSGGSGTSSRSRTGLEPPGPPSTASSARQTPSPPLLSNPPSRQQSRHTPDTTTTSPPPPPPPRGHSPRVPSLVLPSVPRIRVPKKYSPPTINVQEATPIEGPGGGGGKIDITGPLAFPEEYRRRQLQRQQLLQQELGDDEIIETRVQPLRDGEMPIPSGKSYLYG